MPVDTALVVRTTLTTTTPLSGTIGYAAPFVVNAQLAGTVTALPRPGAVITRGQRLYEVDGAAVYLFYGARPAWRPFAAGMPAGPDVEQLEQNLSRLGFSTGLVVDHAFTRATEREVRAWQHATGQPATGRVDLGRITFASGALRVTSNSASLGAAAQPGQPVLMASSPNPVATVLVPVTQTYLVHRGDRVTITLPSGSTTPGRVVEIADVPAPSADSDGRSNGPTDQASIPALVALDHPAAVGHLDRAPVTVTVTDRRVADVLAVPVTSLVALAGGGYAVWVHEPSDTRHLVAVTPGLYAETLVQVTAAGLRVGDRVEVPAP